jgi:hypothetical protein
VPVRRVVCLANSKKGVGYCFAGVDPHNGEWIRPTGAGWEGAVLAGEQTFSSGDRPRLLDLVDLPLAARAPEPGQPENWKLASEQWTHAGVHPSAEALALLEGLATTGPLFGTSGKSLTPEQMQGLSSSLAIIRPTQVRWHKPAEGKLRAEFQHCGEWLDLSVSDPEAVAQFSSEGPGYHDWRPEENPFLIISVTVSPWHGLHWKLAAGVVFL